MGIDTLLILACLGLGFAGLYWVLQRQAQSQGSRKEMEDLVNQVFGMSAQKIAEQSKTILNAERESLQSDMDHKQQLIERLVKQLQEDIKVRQDEIRTIEKDRTRKFSEIVTTLEHHRKITEDLTTSTKQLASVLSNNQQRGQWGERIIEDLLQANGLMEGVHYSRQSVQKSGLKPDITLLLPNQRIVPVDVKFPYAAMQKFAEADTSSSREAHLKQFGQDLKIKIDKVAQYINPEDDTLDYAILFVPNEMLFSFINQRFPELVDRAIQQRVLIVSPFTFLIVARTVMESYRNFMIGDKLKEVIKYIDDFTGEWDKFKQKFEKYGRSLATLQKDYEDLTGTRFRQMDRKIEQVSQYHQQAAVLEDGKDSV